MAFNGTIKALRDGFGFLTMPKSSKHMFFHANNLVSANFLDLQLEMPVNYELIEARDGRQQAGSVGIGEAREEIEDAPEDIDRTLERKISAILSNTSNRLAHEIAKNRSALDHVGWLDLERVVAEVFSELGFQVELTPSSKDGGKDCIVSMVIAGKVRVYYIEVKHWKAQVGSSKINDFIQVIAHDQVFGGLFLASNGYTKTAFESIHSISPKTFSAGDGTMIQNLCQKYVKSQDGVWIAEDLEKEVIFQDSLLH